MNNVLVIGSLNFDETYHVSKMPKCGETVSAKKVETFCGGKGANQAYASAQAGAKTTMIGSIGNDEEGTIIINKLKSVGVDTSYIQRLHHERTGKAIISVDENGENSIIVYPGANYSSNFESVFLKAIGEADIVLIQNEIRREVVEKMIYLSAKLGKIVIYNPAPFYSISPLILRMVNYLTPNEHELRDIVPNKSSTEERIKYLLDIGVGNIIVTLGSEGAQLFNNKENIKVAAPKVNAINTVGAGDCFNGTFAAILGNDTLTKALQTAVYAASLSTTTNGAMESMQTLEIVNKLMEEER